MPYTAFDLEFMTMEEKSLRGHFRVERSSGLRAWPSQDWLSTGSGSGKSTSKKGSQEPALYAVSSSGIGSLVCDYWNVRGQRPVPCWFRASVRSD